MTATPSTPVSREPRIKHLTPVMVVDAVEPCLQFWTERLGFARENEVTGEDDALIFASARQGDVEVMYQSRASVLEDNPDAASDLTGHAIILFLTVENLDDVEAALAGVPVVKARHRTFYGSEELYVREPGGNTVGFAQFA